ncbi:hypothetical protein ACFVJ5_20780 [Nocardia sp. NPDC127606]|uniref:hypothetical protein n=1 Tax=Nocardia sp. NPDC127606 TaxID=3345406 RepID=UPI003645C6B3
MTRPCHPWIDAPARLVIDRTPHLAMAGRRYAPVIRRSTSPVGFVRRGIGPRWICPARHVIPVSVPPRQVLGPGYAPTRPDTVPGRITALHRLPVAPLTSHRPGSARHRVNHDRPTTARISSGRRTANAKGPLHVNDRPVRRIVRVSSRSSNVPDRHRAPV